MDGTNSAGKRKGTPSGHPLASENGSPSKQSVRAHPKATQINGIQLSKMPDINGESAYDQSGFSVSLSNDGRTVAIGAYGNDGNGSDSGHVRVYTNNDPSSPGQWTQVGSDIDGEGAYDQSGRSVSLSSQ